MSKPSSLAHIKKELDAGRNRVKKEFESRIKESEEKAEFFRKRIAAHKKKRDAKIATIEKNIGERADAALKKSLGEKDYRRLHEWLLKKKKEEMDTVRTRVQPTENEDYQRQLVQLDEMDPRDLVLFYFHNKNTLEKELKRDTGIDIFV
jgi:aromatic ring-cleaving dioxygenase